jgi:hypothetical protein
LQLTFHSENQARLSRHCRAIGGPSEYYHSLTVDLYLDQFGSTMRMEARLHGLRTYLAPMLYPSDARLSRKQILLRRHVEIDGVVFNLNTRLTPP